MAAVLTLVVCIAVSGLTIWSVRELACWRGGCGETPDADLLRRRSRTPKTSPPMATGQR
jgi:hypothetical protein